MCGIAGVHVGRGGAPVGEHELRDMLGLLHHRGPDEEGVHVEGRVALGIRRLSIIDPEGSHQPLASDDGSLVLVCNGEIYNFRALRSRLIARGHRFSTGGDVEVILHLYEELGDDLVHELRGMFAFALWDRRAGRLLLARDRLGIKPLYHVRHGERLLFASEIKALFVDPAVPREIDHEGLVHYLSRKFVPAPATLFAGVRALPPGHLLVHDRDGTRVRRWWQLPSRQTGPSSEAEAAAMLRELLIDAVRSHLVSDVPFGAFLSGGVDSSTIVALMSQELSSAVRTYSVGYGGEDAPISETPYARLVAARFGTVHREVLLGARDLVERLPDVVWHLDQPVADEACLPNLLVSELAATEVKMVLTGEGGDELFAGYARYPAERWSPAVGALPAPLRRSLVRLVDALPGLRRPKIAMRALAETDEAARLVQWFPLFSAHAIGPLLAPDVRASVDRSVVLERVREELASCSNDRPLPRMLHLDTVQWLVDDLLARGDKTSMAASLEARVPLLDHPVVEFAASLPDHLKIRRGERKRLLRTVASEWLPQEILDRPKQGFPTPVSRWFRGEARPMLRDALSTEAVRARGLLDPAAVALLLDEHERGRADHGSLLFGLLSLELWARAFLDAPVRRRAGAGSRWSA